MPAVTTFPFLRASSDTIQTSEWVDENGKPLPVDDVLPDWDPWTEIRANREIEINVTELRRRCGLAPDAGLRVVAAWYSPVTALREAGARVDLDHAEGATRVSLGMTIPGHKVAGEISLRTNVVLTAAGSGGGPLSAVFPGSSLWNDSFRIQLEGTGARFPVEVTDFPTPLADAGWKLDIAPELEFPFLGGVRLNINQRNEAVRGAIESNRPGRTEQAIVDMIHADTARQLVRFALSNEEFAQRVAASGDQCPFQRDSTGYALWALVKQLFPDYSIAALQGQLESTPEYFDTLLQHRVHLLEDI